MRTAYRWFILVLLLCSVPISAAGPREVEGRAPARDKPLFVDGVRYDLAVIEHFKGLPMYWVVERHAIHGFTTPEGAQAYGQQHARNNGKIERPGGLELIVSASHIGSGCAGFNKGVGCTGIDWLVLCPLAQYSYLPDSWNDVISCVETGSDVGYYTVLYKCYYFSASTYDCYSHILWVGPGVTITDLNAYGMNNITSSIRFCSNVNPFSCTQ